MGQVVSTPPPTLVEVSYDELTYEALQKQARLDKFTYAPNRPKGIVSRVAVDIFGGVLLYAATFVICDVMRALSTGHWTKVYFMFLGPWNALTGAPLLHRFTQVFDTRGPGTIQHCEDQYSVALKKCDLEYLSGEGGQCHADATAQYQNCYETSPECQQCESDYRSEVPWGKEECYQVEGLSEPYCTIYPPVPSDTDVTIHCLAQLGYDPQ